MKNMRIKTEFIALIAVIIILFALLIFQSSNSVHYKLPEIESINKQDISKIEIKKSDQSLTLIKKSSRWIIDPQAYPCDNNKINDMIDNIANLTLTALVSESKDYKRYGLDNEQKIIVKAFNIKNQLLIEFEIGKQASTFRHTFVKIPDNIKVYQASNSFRDNFDQKIDALRDKLVMKFDKNEITEIEIEKGKKKFHFIKNIKPVEINTEKKGDKKSYNKTPEEQWLTIDKKKANSKEIDSIFNELSKLVCSKYIEDKTKQDFSNPIYTITLKGNKLYSISIFEKIEEKKSNEYPAITSESQYPFILSSYIADNIMKKPEELIKEK